MHFRLLGFNIIVERAAVVSFFEPCPALFGSVDSSSLPVRTRNALRRAWARDNSLTLEMVLAGRLVPQVGSKGLAALRTAFERRGRTWDREGNHETQ